MLGSTQLFAEPAPFLLSAHGRSKLAQKTYSLQAWTYLNTEAVQVHVYAALFIHDNIAVDVAEVRSEELVLLPSLAVQELLHPREPRGRSELLNEDLVVRDGNDHQVAQRRERLHARGCESMSNPQK